MSAGVRQQLPVPPEMVSSSLRSEQALQSNTQRPLNLVDFSMMRNESLYVVFAFSSLTGLHSKKNVLSGLNENI